MVYGLPRQENVLYVKGLKTNQVHISQLYDQNMLVNFTKDRCLAHDEVDIYV